MKEINSLSEYNELIKDDFVWVMFYTKWCPLCKKMKFSLYELNENIPNSLFYMVDISEESEIGNEFKIKSTPTLLIYKQGKLVDKIEGLLEYEELEERLLSFNQ